MAYAENIRGGVSFSGTWWSFVFDLRCLWRHNFTSYSCFKTNVLAKFVDIICIFLYTHSPYFTCHCIEYNLSAPQVRILDEHTLIATRQEFVTAKLSGCALKQGSKTHSSLRQSNLQLQNEAAMMSCRIWAVEHRKCAAGLAGVHPDLQDRILLNYTKLRMRIKYARKLSIFRYVKESSKFLVFLFPCWDIFKCLNASMLKTAVSELVQQIYHAAEIGNVASPVSACADQG